MKKTIAIYGKKSRQKGMSLVELVIYMSILVVLLSTIIQAVLMLSTHYRAVRNTRDLEDSGINVIDRIVREARSASSVVVAGVSASTTATFVTTDSVSGQSTTTRFFIVGDKLHISENNIDLGPLTKESVKVLGFELAAVQNSNSQALKIGISLLSDEATPAVISKNFYNTVVIRGSYQ